MPFALVGSNNFQYGRKFSASTITMYEDNRGGVFELEKSDIEIPESKGILEINVKRWEKYLKKTLKFFKITKLLQKNIMRNIAKLNFRLNSGV